MGRHIFIRLTPDQVRTVAALCLGVALQSAGPEILLVPEEADRMRAWVGELLARNPIGAATLEYVALEMLKKIDEPAPSIEAS